MIYYRKYLSLNDKLQFIEKMSATNKSERVFSLLRFKKQCYYPPVSVDFTPLPTANLGNMGILPQFNPDKKFFTPSFVIPFDYYKHSVDACQFLQGQKEKFLKKIDNNLIQPTQQNIKFNPRDDLYCSICKTSFQCYWHHINSKAHGLKIKNNRSNQYIHDLCSKYKKNRQNQHKRDINIGSQTSKKKTKPIQKKLKQKIKIKQPKYTREDFIITFPKEIFEKDLLLAGCSTNGMMSLEAKR